MKKFFFTLGVLLLLACSAAAGFLYQLLEWSQTARPLVAPMTIPFKTGTGLNHLAQDLEDYRVVDDGFKFQWYVRIFDDYRLFQAGLYQFEGHLSPAQVIQKFQLGQVFRPVALQITIPEGFTLKQITERLAANGVGHIVALQNLVKDKDFIGSLKLNAPSLEGYLYPATYSFETLPSPQHALAKMVQTFFQNIPQNFEENLKTKGLDLHQAVTFASLIELETQLEEEKPLVSEVIWNRLKARMPLGIDAALIYGIPDYKGDILWSHLSDKTNPYNTRIHAGLPPTPIGSPGVKSLEAILTPSNYGYLYYVNIPGTTRHYFSKTLKEHNEQVKKLVEATRRPQGPALAPVTKVPDAKETPDPSDTPDPPSPQAAPFENSTPGKKSSFVPQPAPQNGGPESPRQSPLAPSSRSAYAERSKEKNPKAVASAAKKKAKSKDSKGVSQEKTTKAEDPLKKKPRS